MGAEQMKFCGAVARALLIGVKPRGDRHLFLCVLCASAPPRDISSILDFSRRDAETQRLLELGASPQPPPELLPQAAIKKEASCISVGA